MIQAAPLPRPAATGKICGGAGGGDPPPDPAIIAAVLKAAQDRGTVEIPDDDVTEVTTPGAASHASLHNAGHAGLAFPCADHACRGQDHQPWDGVGLPGHFQVEDWTDTHRTFFFECLSC